MQNQNSLKVDEKRREISEKQRVVEAKFDAEMKEARETFLLQQSEILKEKEELAIEHRLFKAAEEAKLQA